MHTVWRTWWFNLIAFLLYCAASFALAVAITPAEDVSKYIIGGALAYGCGNVHFVLWFTFYTRWRKELQEGQLGEDELKM